MATPQAPTHPDLIEVIRRPGSFESYSVSATDLPAGALIVRLGCPPMTLNPTKRWSSVQVSETQNIELNCDFLYVNHSCEPSIEFHVLADCDTPVIEIRVATRKDENGNTVGIKKGDALTFFYPSTEWDMDQPFDCKCSTPKCLGWISGAKDLTSDQLKGYYLNEHIENLRSVPSSAKSGGKEAGH